LIKLDLYSATFILRAMQKIVNNEIIKEALKELGMTQKELAKSINVSSQAVTNWLKGKDFPRPAALLKLATTLKLNFDQIVQTNTADQPIVAFRKKGNAKTTQSHISKAKGIGMLLKPLVPYLPELQALRTLITSPSTNYTKLHVAVTQTRSRLGIGEQSVLNYEQLISAFNDSGAVLVPVLWGKKQRHENALHIRLPREDVTFIFLNLDTRLEDFKFWMAHELAHVYTPELSGSNEGEDFADAFAGALLFSSNCAKTAYSEAIKNNRRNDIIKVLVSHAEKHIISLNTVYQQVKQYADDAGLPQLNIEENTIHAVRNNNCGQLISEALFDPMPPIPDQYIAICEHLFQTTFFKALKRMLQEQHTGLSYLQQILDSSVHDAKALHEELSH